jgi:hypothetical protein
VNATCVPSIPRPFGAAWIDWAITCSLSPPAPKLRLEPGARVRVLQGPLRDQIGLLAALRPHERVLVLLPLLGGQQRVECEERDRGDLSAEPRRAK